MQVDNETHTPPRSKLEYLYRDLLIECHRLAQRQEALGRQIDESSTRIETFTGQLRQATQYAAQQAGTRVQQAVEGVTTSLNEASQQLITTQRRLADASNQNVKVIAGVAAAAGVLGGLLGVLITTLLLH